MSSQEITRPAPRTQTIMHPVKSELKKLVRAEQAAGLIGPNTSDIVAIHVPGRQRPVYAVKVVRLADPPPRWRRWLWIGTGGISAVAALGAMLWRARYVIGTGLLIATCVGGAMWWIVTRPNHKGGCAGLHCSGCRG